MTKSLLKTAGHWLSLVLIAAICHHPSVYAATEADPDVRRAFTVKDAIERTSFQGFGDQVLKPSPDKQQFAFITSRGDLKSGTVESTVWLVSQDKQGKTVTTPSIKRLSYTNDAPITSLRWVDQGHALAFLSLDEKGHFQVFRYDLRSKKAEQITRVDLNVNSFDIQGDACVFFAITDGSPPFAAPGGYLTDESAQRLIFPDRDAFHETGAVYLQRGHGKAHQLTKHGVTLMRALVHLEISPRGDKAIAILPAASPDDAFVEGWNRIGGAPRLIHDIPNMAVQPYLIDLNAETAQPLLSAPTASSIGIRSRVKPAWSADGKSLLLSSVLLGPKDLQRGQSQVATPKNVEIDLNASKIVRSLPPEDFRQPGERIVELSWKGRGEVVATSAIGGGGGEGIANPVVKRNRWQTKYKRDGESWVVAGRVEVDYSPHVRLGKVEFFVEENANTPPRLVGQEVGATERAFEFDLNPQLSGLQLLPIRAVEWKDKEGHTWSGGLILPKSAANGQGPVPLVLELKFFDPTRFSPDGPYTTAFASQGLAAKGIVVLELNSFDGPTMGTSQEGPMQMRGVESAIDFLVAQHNIDPERIGMIGFSRTCYFVSYTLTHSKRRFAAATLADGLSGGYLQYHLFSLNHSPGHGVKPLYDGLNGGPPWGETFANWIKDSPDMNASKISAPLRIEMIGGYSVLQEWELYSTLKLQNKPVDALFLPKGTHVLVKPQERYLSQQGNVNWFSYWLLGSPGKDKDGEADYHRWEALKVN